MVCGKDHFLRRAMALVTALAVTFAALPLLTSCGKKNRITVWVYSDEYREEIERFLKSTPLKLRFQANIRVVNSGDFEEEMNKAIEHGEEIPDVFMLSPDNITKYAESDITADTTELGLDAASAGFYPYMVEAAANSGGVIKAVGWQADPGIFMYRRSMAKVYLGTDNPDEIQAMLSTWDGFYATAQKIAEQSDGKTRMLAGQEDMLKPYLAADTEPWVRDGSLVISDRKRDYISFMSKMAQEHLMYTAEQWSEAWLKGISDTQSVFGYFSSGICMQYVMKRRAAAPSRVKAATATGRSFRDRPITAGAAVGSRPTAAVPIRRKRGILSR